VAVRGGSDVWVVVHPSSKRVAMMSNVPWDNMVLGSHTRIAFAK
jgi:hypothetical protein